MSRCLSLVFSPVCALALLMPHAATAQEARQFEAFGSFAYLIADVGGNDLGLSNVSGPGFTGEFAFFLNDWLGLGAEVGYATGDTGLPLISIFSGLDIGFSQWTVMFGPRFRFAETDRFRVGAQAMAGIARGSADIDFDIEELIAEIPVFVPRRLGLRAFDFEVDQTAFGASFGVHFDLKINDRLTWRVVQPDVLITNYGDGGQAHFRIASGLGFEF